MTNPDGFGTISGRTVCFSLRRQTTDWLTQLISKLFAFIPRLQLVQPDESGVRTTLGSHVGPIEPGWYIYCPLFQEIRLMTITPQVVDLRPQSLRVDDKDVTVSGAIMYRVSDARKALLNVQDYDRSLTTLALGIIARGELHESEILKGLREAAAGWGIKVMSVFLTDRGDVVNIRLLTNSTSVPIEGWGELG